MNTPAKKMLSGEAVLREAIDLLNELTFDPIRGAVRDGEQVFVSISPLWEDEAKSEYSATVTCQALWHQGVSWEALRLVAHPVETEGFPVAYLRAFDERGRTTFEGLEADTYALSVRHRLAVFRTPSAGRAEDRPLFGVAMGPRDPGRVTDMKKLARAVSDVGDVVGIVGYSEGRVFVEFGTNDETLAGRGIEFCISDTQEGEVYGELRTAMFETEPSRGEFRYCSQVVDLGAFDPGREVEVSFRLL